MDDYQRQLLGALRRRMAPITELDGTRRPVVGSVICPARTAMLDARDLARDQARADAFARSGASLADTVRPEWTRGQRLVMNLAGASAVGFHALGEATPATPGDVVVTDLGAEVVHSAAQPVRTSKRWAQDGYRPDPDPVAVEPLQRDGETWRRNAPPTAATVAAAAKVAGLQARVARVARLREATRARIARALAKGLAGLPHGWRRVRAGKVWQGATCETAAWYRPWSAPFVRPSAPIAFARSHADDAPAPAPLRATRERLAQIVADTNARQARQRAVRDAWLSRNG